MPRGKCLIQSFNKLTPLHPLPLKEANSKTKKSFLKNTAKKQPKADSVILILHCRLLIKQMSKLLVTIHAMDHAVALSNQYSFKINAS